LFGIDATVLKISYFAAIARLPIVEKAGGNNRQR
jgi:hypothetical protein